MVSSNQDNDFSFLEKKDANSLSGKDIFFTILRNLHWLILCALVCGGIAYYHSDRQNRIYESHAKVFRHQEPTGEWHINTRKHYEPSCGHHDERHQ